MSPSSQLTPASPGHAAAARCRPYMSKAQASFLDACKKVGAEYGRLADDQKAVFRADLKIAKRTVKNYALVAARADEKLAVIGEYRGAAPLIPASLRTWTEIVQTDSTILKKAAKAGLFSDYEVSRESVARFKKTGQLPLLTREEKTSGTLSVLKQVKAGIEKLDSAISAAAAKASKVRVLMEENEIGAVRGSELRLLRSKVEGLLSDLIIIDPELLDNVRDVLR